MEMWKIFGGGFAMINIPLLIIVVLGGLVCIHRAHHHGEQKPYEEYCIGKEAISWIIEIALIFWAVWWGI